jgi:RimJ/RimL family protein N-acetyltransferase
MDMKGPHNSEMHAAGANKDVACRVANDWRQIVPALSGGGVCLREVHRADAPSLFAMLTAADIASFISPPPATIAGFERFIAWAQRERAAGRYLCFAVVPQGLDTAVGLIDVRQVGPDFVTAECGFAIGSAYRNTSVFMSTAWLTLAFAFETVGVSRVEARAALTNGGNPALTKHGAGCAGVLRKSSLRHSEDMHQAPWSIDRGDWRQAKVVWGSRMH